MKLTKKFKRADKFKEITYLSSPSIYPQPLGNNSFYK
jgi:hypothetical protein